MDTITTQEPREEGVGGQDALAVFRAALRDIAEAEAIPNYAEAFVWCRDVARAALQQAEAGK